MTKEEFEKALADGASSCEKVGDEHWVLVIFGVKLQAFSNAAKDRMRLLAPVAFNEKASEEQLRRALAANFHADARYGLRNDQLYAVYLHALSSLVETDLRAALRQVAELVRSFGTTYSGGLLRFQWPRPEPPNGGIRRRSLEQVQSSVRRLNLRSSQRTDEG